MDGSKVERLRRYEHSLTGSTQATRIEELWLKGLQVWQISRQDVTCRLLLHDDRSQASICIPTSRYHTFGCVLQEPQRVASVRT